MKLWRKRTTWDDQLAQARQEQRLAADAEPEREARARGLRHDLDHNQLTSRIFLAVQRYLRTP